MVEGSLVLVTAYAISRQAWIGWQHPHIPAAPIRGLIVNASAGGINLVWARVLTRTGRRWKSPALLASGRHIMTDVWTTAAVLVGFALIPLTGLARLDATIAALVALNIVWNGYRMLRESIGGLMDEVIDPELVTALREVISRSAEGAIEAHDVRTRVAGSVTFIEFHLVVPTRVAVEDAHEICDRIEQGIRGTVGDAVINIHIEPEGKAKHTGIVVLA